MIEKLLSISPYDSLLSEEKVLLHEIIDEKGLLTDHNYEIFSNYMWQTSYACLLQLLLKIKTHGYVKTKVANYSNEDRTNCINYTHINRDMGLELLDRYMHEYGYIVNPTMNERLNQLTEGSIIGVGIKGKILKVFVNRNDKYELMSGIVATTLMYRLVDKDDANPEIDELFRKISVAISDESTPAYTVADTVITAIKDFIATTDYFKINYDARMTNLLVKFFDEDVNKLRQDASNNEMSIRDYESLLSELYAKRDKITLAIKRALLDKDDGEEKAKEILEILKSYKTIKKYRCSSANNTLTIDVVQPIHINSKEDFEALIPNIADRLGSNPLNETVLKKIFIEEEYQLITRASIEISIERRTVRKSLSPAIFPDTIAHPHIMSYNCFGTYGQAISQAASENDLAMMIDLCISAASGLNWADGTVVDKTLDTMRSLIDQPECRPFVDKDGNKYNIEEIFDAIEKQQ